MSTTPRRKSHNAIQKTARARSKKKKSKSDNKRASTNSVRIGRSSTPKHYNSSPRASHHRFNNHPTYPQTQPHPPLSLREPNGYHDDNLLDPRDSPPPSPSSRPTHKKNALSSFLSVFNTFSHSNKRRKDSSQSETVDQMQDLELLKRMKRRILDVLSRILDPKVFRRAKYELKSEVWELEYSELKKRLSTHDIHTATIRQKLASAQSLKQLSSLHTAANEEPNDDDEDVREMATFLLQEYFDQPTNNQFEYINVQRDSFHNRAKAPAIIIPHVIKENKSDNERHFDFNHEDSDPNYDEDVDHDEKKAVMTPFDDTPVDEEREHDFAYNIDREKQSKHSDPPHPHNNDHHNNNKNHNKHDPNRKRKKQKRKRKSSKSRKGNKKQHRKEKERELHNGKRPRKGSRTRKFSPRPMADRPKPTLGYDSIPDAAITAVDTKPDPKSAQRRRMRNKAHRIDIRNKFRRGVRKAMLVNAWSNINSSPYDNDPNEPHGARLTLSNLTSDTMISDKLMMALSKVGTWEFDPFEFMDTHEVGGKCLVYAVWYLFDTHDLFKVFPSISPKKFRHFLSVIEEGYEDNPYHNKIHAADVVSNVAYYLNHTQFFAKHISAFDKFTAIISAAVHDVGHDGNNNGYHIMTQSDLAVTYNDISVLENYHVAHTFRVLKRSECNWYMQLSKPAQKYLRSAMIDIVLATDMKFHNQKLAQLTGLVAVLKQQLNKKMMLRDNRDSISSAASLMSIPIIPSYSPNIETSASQSSLMSELTSEAAHSQSSSYAIKAKTLSDFALYKYKADPIGVKHLLNTEISDVIVTEKAEPRVVDVTDERRFMLCVLMHLCDISNCAKSLKSGRKWAVRLMTEFFKQGDRERAQGYDVSAMMDRRRSSTPQSQIGFIKFILRPSYDMFARLVPEASKPLEILNENLKYWQIQQKLMTQQRKKRARSVGSINQAPLLMMMQDQLKMLGEREANSAEPPSQLLSHDTDDEEDAQSLRSVHIKSDIDHNESHILQHSAVHHHANKKVNHHSHHSSHNRHVGFKDIVIVESLDTVAGRECSKSPEVIYMDGKSPDDENENESEINIETPTTTTSKHREQPSGYTNYSMDSFDGSGGGSMSISISTPTLKLRSHSIHVSIPTSEKQIQSQPQPFSEFLSDLRKTYKEESGHHSSSSDADANRQRRRNRTANLMQMIKHKTPKVKQSVSVPVDPKRGGVVAEITVSDPEDEDGDHTPKPNNSNGNKQVFDVV